MVLGKKGIIQGNFRLLMTTCLEGSSHREFRVITDNQGPASHSTSENLTHDAGLLEYSKNLIDHSKEPEGRGESEVSLPAANGESSYSANGCQSMFLLTSRINSG